MGVKRTKGRSQGVVDNIQWGVLWGLFYAVGASLLALIPAVIRLFDDSGEGWKHELNYFSLVLLYVLVGGMSGAVIGLCRPWLRFWVVRRLLGVCIGIGWLFVIHLSVFDFSQWVSDPLELIVWSGIIWGFVMSFVVEEPRARR